MSFIVDLSLDFFHNFEIVFLSPLNAVLCFSDKSNRLFMRTRLFDLVDREGFHCEGVRPTTVCLAATKAGISWSSEADACLALAKEIRPSKSESLIFFCGIGDFKNFIIIGN